MKRYMVWGFVLFNSAVAVTRLSAGLFGALPSNTSLAEGLGFVLITIAFSVMGGVIILRANGNRVGWLMVLVGFALANPFSLYLEFNIQALQADISSVLYLAIWTQGWMFFVVIFAIFWIILHFPSGHPPTARWKWVNSVSIIGLVQFILASAFMEVIGDENSEFFIDNPVGLIPARESIFEMIFGISMIILAVASLVSLFIRFRRAGAVERAQIKWLLFAALVSFSGIAYRMATYTPSPTPSPDETHWTDYLLTISLLVQVLAISIAILRYRLYDIDFIIRKTLQYALLSGILVLIYFGGVVVLQGFFQGLIGNENTQLVTVISTLGIAALFNPLRLRTQGWIDRRFYRAKYDLENALEKYASSVRNEVDVERLTSGLVDMISDSLKPERVSLWMRETDH